MSRVAIVTGANHGIGFETCIGLAQAGFHIVMACRNADKANVAQLEILERLPNASLEVLPLDLGDFGSVRAFCELFRERHDTLNVLINNAGILLYTAQSNREGIELQFATNHLGHFLLTAKLIEMMPDSSESRVVSLSSVGHKGAKIHFDDLACGGDGGVAYGQSKLACLMFSDELNRRLDMSGRKIQAVAAHPGGSDSGLFGEMSKVRYLMLQAFSPFISHSNVSAAKPSLHAALSSSAKGGGYYGPTGFMELRGRVGIAKRDTYANDLSVAKKLWDVSEVLTSQKFEV